MERRIVPQVPVAVVPVPRGSHDARPRRGALAAAVALLAALVAGCSTDDALPLGTSARHIDANAPGLRAEYYDAPDFAGTPLVRLDPTVDFDWGAGSPDPNIAPDTFSVRWTGTITPRYSETYTLHTITDDGVRLWIGDQLVIDNWTDHGATEDTGAIALEAGRAYPLRLEFYENGGDAVARLQWSSPSQALEVVPASQLRTPAASTTTTSAGLRGEYYDQPDFAGTPLVRTDAQVWFDWGTGSPDPSIAPDTFSVRWTGTITAPSSEAYTFYLRSDDGVRLFIDDRLVIDNWTDHAPTENSATVSLDAGRSYAFRLEYYENGGEAVAQLGWSSPGRAREPVPASAFAGGDGTTTTTTTTTERELSDTPGGPLPSTAENRASSDFVYVRDYGARGDCAADDTAALQAALRDALVGTDQYRMKPVLLESGACYRITSPLRLHNAQLGRIIGNGATIEWHGGGDASAIVFDDCREVTIDGLTVRAAEPLAAAVETTNGSDGVIVPTHLTLRNVVLDGNAGRLRDGFIATLGGGGDNNNDLHVLDHVTIRGFTGAGVRIDHSQVHQVRIFNYTCAPAAGAPESYCVQANAGYYVVYGGHGTGTTGADFFIASGSHLLIANWDSRGSRRLLTTAGPTGAGIPIHIASTRFDSSALADDGYAIDQLNPGPLTVRDSILGSDGGRPARIRAYVNTVTMLTVENTVFAARGSNASGPVDTAGGGPHRVTLRNNTFRDASGAFVDASGNAAATPAADPPIFEPRAYITPDERFAGNSVPGAVRVDDPGDCSTDATAAVQRALDAAIDPATRRLHPVVLRAGGCYRISASLVIDAVNGGHLLGNDSALSWAGDAGSPLLVVRNTHNLLVENLMILSSPSQPLAAGISVEGSTADPDGGVDNTFRHIEMEGTTTNGLDTGVRVQDTAGGAGVNAFRELGVRNYQRRGLEITSARAVQTTVVGGYPAANTTESYMVYLARGGLDSLASGGSYTTAADVFLGELTAPVRLVNFNSEGAKRFLVTSEATASRWPVTVIGQRHTTHYLYDGFDYTALDYRLANPLTIESGEIGEGAYVPRLLLGGSGAVTAQVRMMTFGARNSVASDPVVCSAAGGCTGGLSSNLYRDADEQTAERSDRAF